MLLREANEDGLETPLKGEPCSWRDAQGRFKPGKPPGPGRPPRGVERDYLKVMMTECSLEKWAEITRQVVARALKGDIPAAEWLAKYLLGAPKACAPSPTDVELEESWGIDPVMKRLIERLTAGDKGVLGVSDADIRAKMLALARLLGAPQ